MILTIKTELLYLGCQPVMTLSTLFLLKPLETSSKPNKIEYNLKNVDIMKKLDHLTVKATKCTELPDNFQ